MKCTKYTIELIVIAVCSYCTYFLLSEIESWKPEDVIFYIFAITGINIISIACVCDIIETIYKCTNK